MREEKLWRERERGAGLEDPLESNRPARVIFIRKL